MKMKITPIDEITVHEFKLLRAMPHEYLLAPQCTFGTEMFHN